MNPTADKLFRYLYDVIYNPENASLDIDDLDEDFVKFAKGLQYYAHTVQEARQLAFALSKGDLAVKLPPSSNEIAAPLKSLHASLKHLTWQSKRVANGDYNQRVDFMGEFAHAFNTMIQQLDMRQRNLVREIEMGREKARSLEQSNSLLANITSGIPQQIIVIGGEREILYCNDSAKAAMEKFNSFLPDMYSFFEDNDQSLMEGEEAEFSFTDGGDLFVYSVKAYSLHWQGALARAYVLDDISKDKNHLAELELHAYWDNLTGAYSRYFGLDIFEQWLENGEAFSLIFVDLDNLKYVNDNHGHSEGDFYLIQSANKLKTFSSNAELTRLGGDEFMLIAPNCSEAEAKKKLDILCGEMKEDFRAAGKNFYINLSYGVVEISQHNTKSSSELLSLADERMYIAKRLNKERYKQQQRSE